MHNFSRPLSAYPSSWLIVAVSPDLSTESGRILLARVHARIPPRGADTSVPGPFILEP